MLSRSKIQVSISSRGRPRASGCCVTMSRSLSSQAPTGGRPGFSSLWVMAVLGARAAAGQPACRRIAEKRPAGREPLAGHVHLTRSRSPVALAAGMAVRGRAQPMLRKTTLVYAMLAAAFLSGSAVADDNNSGPGPGDRNQSNLDPGLVANAVKTIADGQRIFRFDTFGDEDFWAGTLHLNQAIAQVSPATALSVGLKVDVDALPGNLQRGAAQGQGRPQCAGDDPGAAAAERRHRRDRDGPRQYPDLDGHSVRAVPFDRRQFLRARASAIGSTAGPTATSTSARSSRSRPISASSPICSSTDQATVRTVLNSWGPGKFDAELFLDGKAFRPAASRRRRSSRRPSAWPASTCTPGPAGAR